MHHWLKDCRGQTKQGDLRALTGLRADGTEAAHGFNLIEWEGSVGEENTNQDIFTSQSKFV